MEKRLYFLCELKMRGESIGCPLANGWELFDLVFSLEQQDHRDKRDIIIPFITEFRET
ncbi:MAG: hypothetical protein Q7J55_01800 [bacterium]|nr:hypothetical protein [bacterium]